MSCERRVATEIKFCGLTRRDDAAYAAALGAAYVGAIFAGGPRNLLPADAARLFADLSGGVRRVGVFAEQDAGEIGEIAAQVSLDVVQLHGKWTPGRIREIRAAFPGAIWPVVRVSPAADATAELEAAFDLGDAALVDAFVPGQLGGTGVTAPWDRLARMLEAVRANRPLVLAGGLRSQNVAGAVEILSPNVVDVSSGVESAPGIKDRGQMQAFRDAVAGAFIPK